MCAVFITPAIYHYAHAPYYASRIMQYNHITTLLVLAVQHVRQLIGITREGREGQLCLISTYAQKHLGMTNSQSGCSFIHPRPSLTLHYVISGEHIFRLIPMSNDRKYISLYLTLISDWVRVQAESLMPHATTAMSGHLSGNWLDGARIAHQLAFSTSVLVIFSLSFAFIIIITIHVYKSILIIKLIVTHC